MNFTRRLQWRTHSTCSPPSLANCDLAWPGSGSGVPLCGLQWTSASSPGACAGLEESSPPSSASQICRTRKNCFQVGESEQLKLDQRSRFESLKLERESPCASKISMGFLESHLSCTLLGRNPNGVSVLFMYILHFCSPPCFFTFCLNYRCATCSFKV